MEQTNYTGFSVALISPYSNIPSHAFWRTGVLETDRETWPDLFVPKFTISPETTVATAGSCFAQHIGRYLRDAGVNVLDAEPAPKGLSQETAKKFNYGIYSARYGNIYTTRQLWELFEDVELGRVDPKLIWQKSTRFYDALRPGVEPEGCDSRDEVLELRRDHLTRVGGLIETADLFVFTLGLTESWYDKTANRTLPIAPGVIAGDFDASRYHFQNFNFPEVYADLEKAYDWLKSVNPNIKMLLTVSPVPLTATASGDHVLAATMYSKSVLRAVAGEFADARDDVDYFPSYEVVMTHANAAPAFADNLRSVRPETVARVMQVFLAAHGLTRTGMSATTSSQGANPEIQSNSVGENDLQDDLICEEALLDAFKK